MLVQKLLTVSCKCGVSDSLFHVPISFKHLALVVQRADNSIHRKITIRWITLIRWTAIYPVDSVIQPLNNRALFKNATKTVRKTVYNETWQIVFISCWSDIRSDIR